MIKSIEYNDINKISHKLYNVLEAVTIEDYPIIAEIKSSMINHGAIGSLMSGSGPTVFGFYKSKKSCLYALYNIRKHFRIKECFLTTIFNKK